MLVDQVEHIMEKRVLAGNPTILENHINILYYTILEHLGIERLSMRWLKWASNLY